MEKKKLNVPIKEIIKKYWEGTKPNKFMFFSAYFLYLATQIVNVFVPLYYKKFFDLINKPGFSGSITNELVRIVFIILLIHLLGWFMFRIASFIWSSMQSKVMARLKQNSFSYTILHSHNFFANNFSGSLVQKIGRFTRSFEVLTDTLVFNFTPLVVTIVGALWVTWSIVPKLSIILGIWVLLMTVFSVFFSRWKQKYDIISAAADSKTTGYLSDTITNNTAVSFFTGYDFEVKEFTKISNDQAQKTLFSWNLGNIVDAVQSLLITLVEFAVFYYAIKYWDRGLITVGTFVLAQTYIIGLANQLWGLNRIIRSVYQGLADSKEMVDILLTPYEVQDQPNAGNLIVDKGEIIFDNVSFNFNDDNRVLDNVSIKINPGQKVAIIGHSGAGKTTFVRLIMRLYNITSGSIKIDGWNINRVTQESLRKNISFVPQDPVLFHRTLMDNIRYGRLDATDEEVIEAAKLAHCDDFIDKLPLKYETFVGERGIKLSGGERQRVAIARAMLKKAPILIFDEATSSLDSYSESLIQDALENLMKDTTTIVIAHRLSTIKKMDRIIAMENGQIVEDGNHDDLSTKESGLYKSLWDLQVSGFI
ncbi:MAG: ATP-binding cassette, subfamily B, bacterial [Parcubacteria group bacterium Gr01-1014_46]|nr:MAG: ATP-binding cassette, subfamily B, bacterial [Parcubacteria group bacterium Gr01-1014_46]